MTAPAKNTFSWTEFLVLVAVLGFLAAVLFPSFGRVRSGTPRSMAASDIRQIGQASLIYANDNREQLPGLNLNAIGEIIEDGQTPNIHALAAALARDGGLNDASLWILAEDRHPDANARAVQRVLLDGEPRTLTPIFARSALSHQYIAGLNTGMRSTTPIAFTRGLQSDGKWARNPETSVFGSDGGHVVFLGGNVAFYRNLHEEGGRLLDTGGAQTANILDTVSDEARIFSQPATDTGALDGMPGTGR